MGKPVLKYEGANSSSSSNLAYFSFYFPESLLLYSGSGCCGLLANKAASGCGTTRCKKRAPQLVQLKSELVWKPGQLVQLLMYYGNAKGEWRAKYYYKSLYCWSKSCTSIKSKFRRECNIKSSQVVGEELEVNQLRKKLSV